MYLGVLLIVVLVSQLIMSTKNKSIHLKGIVKELFGIEGSWQERLLGMMQLLGVSLLSLVKVLRQEGDLQKLIVLVLTFITYSVLLKLLLGVLVWLEEYLASITLEIAFSILTPTLILMFFTAIHTMLIRQVAFIALIVSVARVYVEMLHYITGQEVYHSDVKMGKALKVKSIIAWLIIILGNLYTLLALVQFTGNTKVHHFIEAEVFNMESGIDLFYYLVITFTTVGFGDVYPQTPLAKVLTIMIALSGMLFSGMFVATILAVEEK